MAERSTYLMRRHFLQYGLLSGLAILAGADVLMGKAALGAGTEGDDHMGLKIVIQALRSIGNAACMSAAERLEASQGATEYDLYLRSAELGVAEAELIAHAIREVSLTEGPALRTFSMSYNTGLTDEGVVTLTRAFPATLTELGLVECAIGDKGGMALLNWSREANQLRLICVEGNLFSSKIRSGFRALSQERPRLQVVV